MKKHLLATLLGLAALGSVATTSFAQTAYPNRAVRIIVPAPAGTGPDIMARLYAEQLGKSLGQPFTVENRAGASGNIGAEFSSFGTGNGIASRTVVGNARRSARTAIIVVTGLVTAELIGGAVIVERLFAWNGLGRWSLDAILLKDLPAIQGFVLLSTAGTILVYLLSDIVGTLLDPRFR